MIKLSGGLSFKEQECICEKGYASFFKSLRLLTKKPYKSNLCSVSLYMPRPLSILKLKSFTSFLELAISLRR